MLIWRDRGPGWSVAVPGWLDRFLHFRDALIASPRFQVRAASFPLTRFIARRRARDLFDLCAGFVYSQVLLACVQLRLFDNLLAGPKTLPVLARELWVPESACARLLAAAVSLRLVETRGADRFGLGPLGAALANNPGLTAMVEHHARLYEDLRDPVALMRSEVGGTELGKYWAYAGAKSPAELDVEDVAAYSSLMTLTQPLVADEILDAYPFDRHRCLLDVGGGEGAFLATAAARNPNLFLMLFDLPAVVDRARGRLDALGLNTRSAIFDGDFFSDPLPRGADIVTLVRIVLDHEDAKVLKLLRSIRSALSDGGTLLIAEPMAEPKPGMRMGSAYFGFYLLAMGRGRPRTRSEFKALLEEAGFHSVSFRTGRRALQTGLVIAKA